MARAARTSFPLWSLRLAVVVLALAAAGAGYLPYDNQHRALIAQGGGQIGSILRLKSRQIEQWRDEPFFVEHVLLLNDLRHCGRAALTPPEFLPLDHAGSTEARLRGACTPYAKQYLRADGTRVWVIVGYVLIGAARERSVAFILDISRRRAAEEAVREMNEYLEDRVRERTDELEWIHREMEAFSFSVSHDPLALSRTGRNQPRFGEVDLAASSRQPTSISAPNPVGPPRASCRDRRRPRGATPPCSSRLPRTSSTTR